MPQDRPLAGDTSAPARWPSEYSLLCAMTWLREASVEPIGFDGVANFVRTHRADATKWLDTYFSAGSDGGFTGRWFEHFSALSDENHLDANDVAAAAALSVPLSGKAVSALFECADEFNAHLAAAPGRSVALWEVDSAELDNDAPLAQAYSVLRSVPGIGYVTASKILACKRPNLVPIRDTVVERLLAAGSEWWMPWRRVIADRALRDLIDDLTPDNVPPHTSVLRRLDVILWRAETST